MSKTFFDFYIDRGGTFTDVFCRIKKDGEISEEVFKLLSEDPSNYENAPREAIRRVVYSKLKREEFKTNPFPSSGEDFEIRTIRMGTTVSTNALLERKGARTAFLSSKGFQDLLEIAYQDRPDIFALEIKKAQQVYEINLELEERVFLQNEIENHFDEQAILGELKKLKEQGIESLAISLIHAYKYPEHEARVKELAQSLGFQEISTSSELVPMIKYVTRSSTTVIDAYLAPIIKKYIADFKSGFSDSLKNTDLLFIKSDGGLTNAEGFRGFNSILSGPAGGLTALSSLHKDKALIGFDMGGTSTDVSRFDGQTNLSFDSKIKGLYLQSPQLDINTIAAGGGSRLFVENGLFRVGPESAGSDPGPISYKKDGYLAITDANLVLGRLNPDFFPKVFGANADEALDYQASYKAFEELKEQNRLSMTVEEIAAGFIEVANETMARPIREVSSAKGYDVQKHELVCFGGAAAQHAVAIARKLNIEKVLIHQYSGILSAFGIAQAQPSKQIQKAYGKELNNDELETIFSKLRAKLSSENFNSFKSFLLLRYEGTDSKFLIEENPRLDFKKAFSEKYKQEFNFILDKKIICDDVIVRGYQEESKGGYRKEKKVKNGENNSIAEIKIFFDHTWHKAKVYKFEDISEVVIGPALIIQDTATIVLEPGSKALINNENNLEITVEAKSKTTDLENNPINLAIFANRFMSIAEQMGKTLERTSISTNIKERRDFSCAIFNKEGDLIANAPHQPVHLGSMGYAVKKQIEYYGESLKPGDSILSNHPIMGGSHLPDLTVMTPIFNEANELIFFVANRAHHADIGGISPGSMPSFSTQIDQEGIAIKSFKIVSESKFQEQELRNLFQESRLLEDNISDLKAQLAANKQGADLIKELITEYSQETVLAFMNYILENSEAAVRKLFKSNDAKELRAHDFLDDGSKIELKISIDQNSGEAVFDFTGTAAEQNSNLNTPIAVVNSAVLYCLRVILQEDIPLNQGFLKAVKIIVPEKSLLNPSENKAVVAGNVQTSQRIVDVIFKAFNTCAASQGCMNNVIFGNEDFGYYETIGGGVGAIKGSNGASGVHSHMTNTRITDPEILESRYPVILKEFSIRKNSGGDGSYKGGDGLTRIFRFLDELELSLLTERRVYQPYGLNGAQEGAKGENTLVKTNGDIEKLSAKSNTKVSKGDELIVSSPGGGAVN